MTSQSIYTEYTNLIPDHIEWLDGCGATWASGDKFSEISEINLVELRESNEFIWLNHPFFKKRFSYGIAEIDATLIPTGSEFCERVAEILGIEKPVFGLTTAEKNRLIDEANDKAEAEQMKKELSSALGIDKPVFGDKFIKAFEPNEDEINKGIDKAEKEWQAKDKVGEDLEKFGIPIQPTHPHRVYLVLDSLDGIPFDTRMPLSEWIPPMGVDVNFIHNGDFDRGQIQCIDKHGIIVKWRGLACVFESDGHWMRIV